MTEVILQQILAELRNPLGFVDPPYTKTINCNSQYGMPYFWNGNTKEYTFIPKPAICCILEGTKLEDRVAKGKPYKQLHIRIRADQSYTLVTGLLTTTGKSMLLSLLEVDVRKSVTFFFQQGRDEENVLLCNIFQNGRLIYNDCKMRDITNEHVMSMFEELQNRIGVIRDHSAEPAHEEEAQSSESEPTITEPDITGQHSLPVTENFSVDDFRKTIKMATTLSQIEKAEQVWQRNKTQVPAMNQTIEKELKAARHKLTQIAEAALADPDDVSNLILAIGNEVERVGWTRQQGSAHLQEAYKKKTRAELDTEQLLEFLIFLKGLPDKKKEAVVA